jgi:hypothetical protein
MTACFAAFELPRHDEALLSINPTTGVITGKLPRTQGHSNVTITVSATKASRVTWHFTWTIND